jgi:hypothetical protein
LLVAGAYLYTLSRTPTVKVPTPVRTPVWLWLLPALVLINGLNPYLGLRTQLSFSMFSNLRTEGGRTNHLFMPRLITLQPYEDDLVEVIEASDPILQDLRTKELLLPYFEFQAMINELDNVRVTYLRNGTEHKVSCVDWVCDDADLGTPHPRMRRAFFYFRAVDKGPKMQCRH